MESGTVSFLEPSTKEVTHILSSVGSRQGCSLGSFLFALAIHEDLVNLQNTHKEVQIEAYLDDLFFVGPPDLTLQAFSFWKSTYTQNLQGSINITKCKVFAPSYSQQQLLDLKFPSDMKFSNDGVKVLGVPVGNDNFILSLLTEKISDIERQCDLVGHMTSQHCQLVTISKAIQHQITFLLRNIPAGDISLIPLAARYDKAIQSVISRICHKTIIDKTASAILNLPQSMGGIGIRAFRDIADPAYLAAFTFSSFILPSLFPQLKNQFQDMRYYQPSPNPQSISNCMQQAFNAYQRLNSISNNRLHDRLNPSSSPTLHHLQASLTKLLDESKYQWVLSVLRSSQSKYAKPRLAHFISSIQDSWSLSTIPKITTHHALTNKLPLSSHANYFYQLILHQKKKSSHQTNWLFVRAVTKRLIFLQFVRCMSRRWT